MPFIAGKSEDEREWVSVCLSRGSDLDRVDGLDSLVLEDNGVTEIGGITLTRENLRESYEDANE